MNQLFDMRPERPGYRLQQLEVYNWGTFDSSMGQVFRFEPQGRTSLLVGHNGSGKSTLVDAITTLLVDNRSRNYNVAAGAKRSERTPKSYIKGAFDRTADDSQSSVVRFLRPRGNHLTAISGVFQDEQLDKAFTLLQVLYLRTDGTDDKIYAIANSEHALKDDLQGLLKSDQVRDHLKRAGYQTTKVYAEYLGWITKRTGMRGKAVDMFNQTVAVKDIQSLNDFIRKHMLESHNWREKIQRLLTHFHDLSTAHQELVRARRQVELLLPVEKLGRKYREQAYELQQLELGLEAATSFFPQQFVNLFEPEIEFQQGSVATMATTIKRLDGELKAQQEAIRQLKNEIDRAGGERLKQLPELINTEEARLVNKQANFDRFHEYLTLCHIKGLVTSGEMLDRVRQHLRKVTSKMESKLREVKSQYDHAVGTKAGVEQDLANERDELESLQQRRTNLPPRFTAMRSQVCRNLNLDESALPFAAELLSVSPDERRWEASAEMVLNSFALSLLVPDRYYQRVRAYVERNRINDERGHGGRIDYIRVGVPQENAGDRIHPNSLFNKLLFKPRHDLTPWVRGEVLRRFDFRCCENDTEFNETSRLALTENRHVKFNKELHKKDDRQRTVDPRFFVLGWDNSEKKRRIAAHIKELEAERKALADAAIKYDAQVGQFRETIRAAQEALKVTEYDSIDLKRHQTEIATLRKEQRDLEDSNDVVKALKKRVKTAEASERGLAADRDEQIGQKATVEKQIELLQRNISVAKSELQIAKRDGIFEGHAKLFAAITQSLGEPPLTIVDFDLRQRKWESETRERIARLRDPLQKISDDLVNAMAKFLREFKEEKDDLDASVRSIDSFLGLLAQLNDEGLPRHEEKFKNRLNDRVTQEIALFNTALREERKEIENKIEQLNEALASVEYDRVRNTYMRLDPRPVHDREIEAFRRSLRECLDESLEGSDEANETRFHRIKELVGRLSDKEKITWRNKVIDVRNWYDFAALELERETDVILSCYESSSGQSGGEKAKLAFTILVAALAYQFDVDPTGNTPGRLQFVVVDEMFSKVDDQNAQYALELFKHFGLQLLIVAPLDAKARITEPFVDRYLHVVKDATTHHSQLYSMTAREYDEVVQQLSRNGKRTSKRRTTAK